VTCEAEWRVAYNNDTGWVCEGPEGVSRIYLMDGSEGIPIVGPEDALVEFLSEPWGDVYHPRPFRGGDHYHAVLPSRKPAESER